MMTLEPRLSLEMGRLEARATLESPVVSAHNEDDRPTVEISEGGVRILLEFPYPECITRFQRSVETLAFSKEGGPQ